MDLAWHQGWNAGLILGAVCTLVIEATIRFAVFKLRHRKHNHCGACHGCLDGDGRAVAAIETLLICPLCGDTVPEQHVSEADRRRYFAVRSIDRIKDTWEEDT